MPPFCNAAKVDLIKVINYYSPLNKIYYSFSDFKHALRLMLKIDIIMKSSDIIISVLVTLSTLSPVVYLYFHSKSRYYRVFKSIKSFFNTHNYYLSDFEIWESKGLAIDMENKILVFSDQYIEKTDIQFVELSTIRKVDLCVGKNEILIELKSRRGHSTVIPIYDAIKDDPFQKGFYMEIAKRWSQQLQFLTSYSYHSSPPKAA